MGPIYPEGATHLPKGRLQTWINHVGPRYFETMGIPVLLGRGVRNTDNSESHPVGWLSESAAGEAFPEGSPVGRMFRFWDDEPGAEVEVVGVVADAKYDKLKADVRPTVYVPFEHNEWMSSMNFVVRAAGHPEALVSHARAAIRELDADVPMIDVTTQQRQIDNHLRIERAFAKLSTAFGLLAMLLACVGIYGVLAYAVARRTGEIGIRMALGAQHADIAWLVLRQTVLLLALGVAFGIAGALGATRLIASMLYGLEPHDPVTLAGAALVIVAVALGRRVSACPARRAGEPDRGIALGIACYPETSPPDCLEPCFESRIREFGVSQEPGGHRGDDGPTDGPRARVDPASRGCGSDRSEHVQLHRSGEAGVCGHHPRDGRVQEDRPGETVGGGGLPGGAVPRRDSIESSRGGRHRRHE